MKKTIFLLSAFITTLISTAQVTVSTLAGSTLGFADGTGVAAQFYNPEGVATDAAGNVYVADTNNHKIRKISPAGEVSTFAGSTQGYADGPGASAQFDYPVGLATDILGNVYIADRGNHKIRKITSGGVVSTLAGSSDGDYNGTGTAARFSNPYGVATDATGNVYVADAYNNKIRKITPSGEVSTFAGSSSITGFADGPGVTAKFSQPSGVATDIIGNVYVADVGNHKIRKISPVGVVSTLAGSTVGFADGTGAAAQFNTPSGLATDSAGNVYVVDTNNQMIRKISPIGEVTTLAGSTQGFADGTGVVAEFSIPFGVATDSAGNIYIADEYNHKIRKITQTLGVAQNEVASKIKMYPNPVTTVLTLQLENGCVVDKITITDLSGKIIITQSQNTNTINVEKLAQGVYILEAYSGQEKQVSKFVKE